VNCAGVDSVDAALEGIKIAVENGILAAGTAGNQLCQVTLVANKELQTVYGKPGDIYCLFSVLMTAGVRDVQLISTPYDTPRFGAL
jgi:glucose-1-phosphate thymidylyltransferase